MHGFDGFISLHHRDNRSPIESCVSAACVAAATVWKNLKGKTYELMVCKSQPAMVKTKWVFAYSITF